MKKTLSVFAMAVVIAGALAACGPTNNSSSNNTSSKGTTASKPAKLVVWEDQKKSGWLQKVAADFKKKYGITVEYKEVEMATKMGQQLRLDGPAGKGPDIVTLPHDQIGQVVTEGLIAPLNVDQSVVNRFSKSSIAAETYKGKLYGLPKSTETPVFVYNKDLMKTPPKTMEDLYNFSKGFTKNGNYGFLALFDNYYFAHGIMASMGSYVFKNNNGTLDPNDLGLNNAGAIQGANYMAKWYKEGLFPRGIIGANGGSTVDGLFTQGKVASVMNGPWAFQPYTSAGIKIGMTAMPTLNGQHIKTFMGVKGWHVSAFSKNQEWATKLVDFMTSDENAKYRFTQTQEVPPNVALLNDPVIKDNEGAKAVAEQSQYAEPMPNIPETAQVWTPMGNALQTVVTGKADAKTALDNAVKQIKDQIKSTK
ncbi:extracellular solute-binding protein [Heyndrickxia acidicola]|uniref:Extracellular solute-binding protein n=1 Tax=Heyndrickxia acidicola TaxID=209389 RepID=A0ABU6MD43_9BACI|nr:extracellular solute-binding protein [Heyndrickxia acidicola]MED1202214.1 extracellular solute-binding protein [Heyndrickxia acidicola]